MGADGLQSFWEARMRMWNLDPKLLCKQHLLGEHFEIHKAVGNLRHSGTWSNSLTAQGFLEPQNFAKRHKKLAKEMQRRGYKHNSELDVSGIKLKKGKVDINRSIKDLKKRCKECFKK